MGNTETVKISAAQAAQVYAEVPNVLRKLASERDSLVEKLASAEAELGQYRLTERMSKMAFRMADRKINGQSYEDHLQTIKEAHSKGRSLDAIEEAIEMTAPNGEIAKIASEEMGNGANQLEAYLIGGLSD